MFTKGTYETGTNDIQQLSGNKRIYALSFYRFRRKNTVLKYLSTELL
jgi:hypothetical protein